MCIERREKKGKSTQEQLLQMSIFYLKQKSNKDFYSYLYRSHPTSVRFSISSTPRVIKSFPDASLLVDETVNEGLTAAGCSVLVAT